MHARFPAKLEFLFQQARYKVAYGGRGGAKSWGFARALLLLGFARPLRILCTREIQTSIADSVHKILGDQTQNLGLEAFYVVTKDAIRGANGTEFSFHGLRQQDVHTIKSFEGVDICWVEEAQTVTQRSWNILTPTIRKDDSEIWVSFNPELDSDETYQRFVVDPPANAIVVKVGWQDNPWLPKVLQGEREDTLRRNPDGYRNIWEGEPRTTVEGAIYASEVTAALQSGRVRDLTYDPMLKVHTVWDLGFADAMAISMVQKHPTELRIIDYIEDTHRDLASYVAEIETRKYVWGKDWLPHDAQSRDHKFGKSTQEILNSLGRKTAIIPRLGVEDGIKTARLIFPRCYFDRVKTERLVTCLKRYRRVVHQTTGAAGEPLHDEYSNGADCFRYLSIAADHMTNEDYRASWGNGPIPYERLGRVI